MPTFNALAAALKHLEALLQIPATVNDCAAAADYVEKQAKKCGWQVEREHDDSVHCILRGNGKTGRMVGYGAHLDRIGFMVKKLHEDGTVEFNNLGGLYPGHVLDGVCGTILTAQGAITGTITHLDVPIHKVRTLKEWEDRPHKFEKLRFCPDATIGCNPKEGKKLLEKMGIEPGQSLMPDGMLHIDHTHRTLRGRWLDNTLGCVVLLALMERYAAEKKSPHFDIDFFFSVAEESGMGGTSALHPDMTDFMAIDVAVAEDVQEEAKKIYILQKDARLSYNKQLVKELEAAAQAIDLPFYREVSGGGSTDAAQARSAGFKGRIAGVGMPIFGMHSIERGTFEVVENCLELLYAHANQTQAAPKKAAAKKK